EPSKRKSTSTCWAWAAMLLSTRSATAVGRSYPMSRRELMRRRAEGRRMIGAGISSEIEAEGHCGPTVGRGAAGAVPVDRTQVALRAQGLAHVGAQVQQRTIERRIGSG